jgi:hypothetical protein
MFLKNFKPASFNVLKQKLFTFQAMNFCNFEDKVKSIFKEITTEEGKSLLDIGLLHSVKI